MPLPARSPRGGLRQGAWPLAVAFACVALVLGAASPAHASHASLAGHWPLDGAVPDGSRTPDVSGHGNDALLAPGTPFATDGRLGGALDERLELRDVRVPATASASVLEAAQVTLTAWVRAAETPGAQRFLVAKGGNDTCADPANVTTSYALATDSSGRLVFMSWDGVQGIPTQSPAAALASTFDGQWHAVAGVFDGTRTRLYVDGAQVGDGASGTASIAYGLQERSLTIGRHPLDACSGHFPALIDDVRVYARALAAGDLEILARGEELPAPPPGDGSPAPPGGGPPAVQPPANRERPAIAAEPRARGTYRCRPGAWDGVPAGAPFRYAWRDVLRGGVAATTPTFEPGPADYGYPFYCAVTVGNAGGDGTATSDSVFFTSAGINALPPAYGNLRIRGIDVFQTVQPESGAQMFGFPSGGFPSLPGIGTPTSFRPAGIGSLLESLRPQEAQYAGVTLDSLKSAHAIVYLNVAGAAAADTALPLEVTLTARRGGKAIGAPLVRQVRNPPRSDALVVSGRDRERTGVFFKLPAQWLAGGALDLEARVAFHAGQLGATYGRRECDRPCASDNAFTVKGVRAQGPPQLVIGSIQLTRTGQASLPAPATVLSAATRLFPGGERMVILPYGATLDITTEAGLTGTVTSPAGAPATVWTCNGQSYTAPNFTTLAQVTRACRISAVSARVLGWLATNPAREIWLSGNRLRLRQRYDLLLAAHNYGTGNGTNIEPGWQDGGDVRAVTESEPLAGAPYLTVTASRRPLTAAAHELGHALSAPHADQTCGGSANGQVGEPWAPDNRGRLQGTRFVAPAALGKAGAVVQTDDGIARTLYDLMSYCANNADTSYRSPGDAWLSAFNWNRFVRRLQELGSRVGYGARPAELGLGVLPSLPARAAQSRTRRSRLGVAVGLVGPVGGKLVRVDPPDRERADVPAAAGSTVRVRSLDAGGRVLLDAGVEVRTPSELPAGSGGTFAGPVDPRAAVIELVRDGAVVDILRRGAAPRVRLASPRRGVRVRRRGALAVRWSSSDRDSPALAATVQFSVDRGRSWRTVFDGPDRGVARVPGAALEGTRDGRVRVVVSDGISSARATSGRVVADGSPPVVRIISPDAGETLVAGDRVLLAGAAVNDLGHSLSGRSLRWFAGRRPLGRGERVRARLPAGRPTLRLVARDRRGATARTSVRVTVRRRPLRVLSLRFPRVVARGARAVRGTIAVSDRARLASGGRRFAVGRRARRVTLALPGRPRTGLVRAVYTVRPRSRAVAGVVRAVVEVVRR